jgi:hypothetical protein
MRALRLNVISLGILVLMVAFMTGSVMAQEAMPVFSELTEGWNVLSPGGETTCALGDPYRFFVRPGTENKLLINFEGSANCQDEASCRELGTNPYIYSVPDDDWRGNTAGDYPGAPDFRENEGILQTDFADNPFQNYTIVMLPACTFDAHMGDNVMTYGEGDSAFDVHYKGHVNATAALDWVYANIETPDSIISISCDAGTLVHLPGIVDHYDSIPFTHFNDSTARLRDDYSFLFDQWGTMGAIAGTPAFAGIAANELTVVSALLAEAALSPEVRYAGVETIYNAEQADFLANLPPSLEELHAGIPNFRSYVGWGEGDCMLVKPDFYTHQTNGVRLRDWVAAVAAGEDVDNVQCTDCETPELYEG